MKPCGGIFPFHHVLMSYDMASKSDIHYHYNPAVVFYIIKVYKIIPIKHATLCMYFTSCHMLQNCDIIVATL